MSTNGSSNVPEGANIQGIGRRRPPVISTSSSSYTSNLDKFSGHSHGRNEADTRPLEGTDNTLPVSEETRTDKIHDSTPPPPPSAAAAELSQPVLQYFRIVTWALVLAFLIYQTAKAYEVLPWEYRGNHHHSLSPSASRYSYYIAQNLFNNEDLFPRFTEQLVRTIQILGTDNVYVSIFEGGSTDRTPQHLHELDRILEDMEVKHEILTVRNSWWEFCFAIGKSCKQTTRSLRNNPTSIRIPILSIFRNMALRPLYLTPSVKRDDNRDGDQFFVMNKLSSAIRDLWSQLQDEKDADPDYLKSLSAELEAFLKAATMEKINSNSLWNPSKYEPNLGLRHPIVILFMNDILLYPHDILSLVNTNEGPDYYDMACGMDFEILKFYDVWIARDIKGFTFSSWYPYVREPNTQKLLREKKPFPVYSCWNGATAMHAHLLIENQIMFRFARRLENRSPNPSLNDQVIKQMNKITDDSRLLRYFFGLCAASECQLICKDLWSAGATRILMNPSVKLYYNEHSQVLHSYVLPFFNHFILSWFNRIHATHPSLRRKDVPCNNVYSSPADMSLVDTLVNTHSWDSLERPEVDSLEHSLQHELQGVYWLHPKFAPLSISAKRAWSKRLQVINPPYQSGRVLPFHSPLFISCGGDGADFCSQMTH